MGLPDSLTQKITVPAGTGKDEPPDTVTVVTVVCEGFEPVTVEHWLFYSEDD